VRIRAKDAGGSGTVIYSKKGEDGFYSTLILTCDHVIAGCREVKDQWDSVLKKDRKKEILAPVIVEFFNWDGVPHGKAPLTHGTTGDIVAYNERHDIALVRLRLRDKPPTAKLLPPKQISEVIIGSPVTIVGCALLHDPILTQGIVTHQGDIIDGFDYWMSNAQIIFGNSGGAAFTRLNQSYYFIGIPSRIDVSGWSTPITHLGYFSPISRIYKFFEEQMFDFLIPGSAKTEAECEAEREERLQREERKMYE
jgi:hypothetical protein